MAPYCSIFRDAYDKAIKVDLEICQSHNRKIIKNKPCGNF